jgi:thioredoxin reductase (NADPH)
MIFDVVIIGAGVGGLTAGIYSSRNGLKTLLLEKEGMGGKLNITEKIENYPGFPGGIESSVLAANMMEQGLDYGMQFKQTVVTRVALDVVPKEIYLDDGDVLKSDVVIIATGSKPKCLGVPGEEKYLNHGVHYCAICDGPDYAGKEVVLVGGGNSALEEALFMIRYASKMTIVHEFGEFQASRQNVKKVMENEKFKFVMNSHVTMFEGDEKLTAVRVKNLKDLTETVIPCAGAFIYCGSDPETQLFIGQVDMEDDKYIKTDREMQTNIPGVFAVGDVVAKGVRQVATAVGDGATAAVQAEKYLSVL